MKRIIILVVAVLSVSVFAVIRCNMSSSDKKNTTSAALTGEQIYSANCLICHGADGKAQMSGATDLSTSVLKTDAAIQVVANGRNGMRPFSSQLTKDEIAAVVMHIETLRK